jgi:hypothetical protein
MTHEENRKAEWTSSRVDTPKPMTRKFKAELQELSWRLKELTSRAALISS